jgi:hypothetical protein
VKRSSLRPPDLGTGRVERLRNYLLAETGFARSPTDRTRRWGWEIDMAPFVILLFRVTKSSKLRIMAQRDRTPSFPRLTKVAILRLKIILLLYLRYIIYKLNY